MIPTFSFSNFINKSIHKTSFKPKNHIKWNKKTINPCHLCKSFVIYLIQFIFILIIFIVFKKMNQRTYIIFGKRDLSQY